MLEKHADPEFRQLHIERTSAGTRASLLDPVKLKARQENGRRCGMLGLGVQRLGAGHPARIAAGRKLSETRMGWCPLEYRDEYRRLVRSKLVSAAEARRMIEDMIAADMDRYVATGILPQSQRIAKEPAYD